MANWTRTLVELFRGDAATSAQFSGTEIKQTDDGTTTDTIQWLVVDHAPGIVMESLVVRNTGSSANDLDCYVAVALDDVTTDPTLTGTDPALAGTEYLETLEVDPTLSSGAQGDSLAADDEFPYEFDRLAGAVAIGVVSASAGSPTDYEIEFRGASA